MDKFGFDYEFKSATETYKAGEFDETLLLILKNYTAVTDIILPTLGAERRATYSPFLPICPETGVVLQTPVIAHDADAGPADVKRSASAGASTASKPVYAACAKSLGSRCLGGSSASATPPTGLSGA